MQNAGLSGQNAGQLWSAFMDSSTDVWAVGQTQSQGPPCSTVCGVFWHWSGVAGLGGGWNTPQAPIPNVIFYSVFMVSSTEGWAVGSGGVIYHYFGGQWDAFQSPVTSTLRSLYMLSPTEGWAVGDNGVIIHYSAGLWAGPVSPGTTSSNLLSVYMVSSTEGWAYGKNGAILHYSGGAWSALPSNLVPTSPVSSFSFDSAYFNSPTDGWAVGTDGEILHFDGSIYGGVTSPTIDNFTSVSFGPPLTPLNPNDGWAVGNSSRTTSEPTIYHWNGFVWTKGVAIGTMNNLNSVFMINTGDVWTVGGGNQPTGSCSSPPCPVIMHFTGGSWNTITPPPGAYSLNSTYMISSNEGWAVGTQSGNVGIILHYTNTGGVGTWATFPAPSTPNSIPGLNSVFMVSQSEGWAVGKNETILHYTVSGGVGTWNLISANGLSTDASLNSIFMLSPTSGWAVGGISVPGVTDGPVIVYWDGTKWTPVSTPTIPGGITATGHTSGVLKSVFLTGPKDGWAVGYPGILMANVLHWDGYSWNYVSLSPALMGVVPPILTSVYMTSPSSGWIVGASPDFPQNGSPTNQAAIGTYYSGPGFKQPLSTILRFAPFGGAFSTMTVTSVSTISTNTAATVSTTTVTTTTSSMPPATVTASVKVVDNQGTPEQGANVTVLSLGLHGLTNAQGIVTFTLPPGTYSVSIAKNGSSTTTTINATGNGQTSVLTFAAGGAGIPGFPVESVIGGLAAGLFILSVVRHRRSMRTEQCDG